jgi:hypothetical protein
MCLYLYRNRFVLNFCFSVVLTCRWLLNFLPLNTCLACHPKTREILTQEGEILTQEGQNNFCFLSNLLSLRLFIRSFVCWLLLSIFAYLKILYVAALVTFLTPLFFLPKQLLSFSRPQCRPTTSLSIFLYPVVTR